MRSRSDLARGAPAPVGPALKRFLDATLAKSRTNRKRREVERDAIRAAEKVTVERAEAEMVAGRRAHLEACGVADERILEALCSGKPLRPTAALVAVQEWIAGTREYPLGSGKRCGMHERPICTLTWRGSGEGAHGVGKSLAGAVFLLQAVRYVESWAHELSEGPVRLPVLDHRRGLRVTAERLHNCRRFDDYSTRESLLDRAATVPYLLVDELRQCDLAGAGRERFEEVLGERYDRRRPTVITSNCGSSLFTRMLGPRLESRIRESGCTIDCSGPDLREEKRR